MIKTCISNTPTESVWLLEDNAGHVLGKAIVDNSLHIEYYSLWRRYTRQQIKAMFNSAKTSQF